MGKEKDQDPAPPNDTPTKPKKKSVPKGFKKVVRAQIQDQIYEQLKAKVVESGHRVEDTNFYFSEDKGDYYLTNKNDLDWSFKIHSVVHPLPPPPPEPKQPKEPKEKAPKKPKKVSLENDPN